jgi:hypothetical protein
MSSIYCEPIFCFRVLVVFLYQNLPCFNLNEIIEIGALKQAV